MRTAFDGQTWRDWWLKQSVETCGNQVPGPWFFRHFCNDDHRLFNHRHTGRTQLYAFRTRSTRNHRNHQTRIQKMTLNDTSIRTSLWFHGVCFPMLPMFLLAVRCQAGDQRGARGPAGGPWQHRGGTAGGIRRSREGNSQSGSSLRGEDRRGAKDRICHLEKNLKKAWRAVRIDEVSWSITVWEPYFFLGGG